MENKNNLSEISRIGKKIDLKTAAKWTYNFRQRNPNETISHLFGKEIIDNILSQPDCSGIRIYYANSKSLGIFPRLLLILINFLRNISGTIGEDHLIITGTNSKGIDQIPGKSGKPKPVQSEIEVRSFSLAGDSNSDYSLAEMAMPCPASGCPSNELTGS